MIIDQIWTGNRYRNFNYLIACKETGEALAVDPCDYKKCLARADAKGWDITQVLNTHEHPDHISGNKPVIKATGARLLAHHDAGSRIKGVDVGLAAGDVVRVGRTVELQVLDTPGHTMCHICLLAQDGAPLLISGDTIFAAGAGHCRMGGDPVALYDTFATQISRLPDETRIYPGHDYLVNNLGFTLDREPDNLRAKELLRALGDQYQPDPPLVTTIGLERDINPFLRLDRPALIERLCETIPGTPRSASPREVFLKLRELRNSW